MASVKVQADTVLRAKDGDQEAMGDLFVQIDPLIGWVMTTVSWRGDMEDGMQEGRLGVLEALKRFDPERGTQFTTYAFSYIRKAIQTAMQDTPVYLEDMETEYVGDSPVDAAYLAEVRDIVNSLPEAERNLIYSRFYEGKTLEEIAGEIGKNHRFKVSVKIRKALEKIEAQLIGAKR